MVFNELYHKACDIAHDICPPFAVDIVHDGFVAWYEKHNNNLFDESEETVREVIRKVYNKKYHSRYKQRVARLKAAITVVTPEDELIEQEMGLRFMEYDEIRQRVEEYEMYHRFYQKLHEN